MAEGGNGRGEAVRTRGGRGRGAASIGRVLRLLVLAAVALPPLAADARPFGPFGSPGHPVTSEAARSVELPKAPRAKTYDAEVLPSAARASRAPKAPDGFAGHPLGLAFALYRDVLTKIDGPRCGHAPVCSIYGREAVRRHGIVGLGLGVERLWRDEQSSPFLALPRLRAPDGTTKAYDPLPFSAAPLTGATK